MSSVPFAFTEIGHFDMIRKEEPCICSVMAKYFGLQSVSVRGDAGEEIDD